MFTKHEYFSSAGCSLPGSLTSLAV